MMILHKLNENVAQYRHKTALSFLDPPESTLTYGELDRAIGHTQAWLHALGVQPGDRVALQLPKCLEFILLHLACLRMGAITLPLNPAYPLDELRYFLELQHLQDQLDYPPSLEHLQLEWHFRQPRFLKRWRGS